MEKAKCKTCGKEFTRRTNNQLYCGKNCRKYEKKRKEVKGVHENSESPRGRRTIEDPWDVRAFTEVLKEKLVVGKSYLLELKELELDGTTKKVLKRVKLVGIYPHHAQFENAMGIRTHLSFRWWELKGLLKGGC